MNTKRLLFASSLPFTSPAVKQQFGNQPGAAPFTPGYGSTITAGTCHVFTSMYNMHCCC